MTGRWCLKCAIAHAGVVVLLSGELIRSVLTDGGHLGVDSRVKVAYAYGEGKGRRHFAQIPILQPRVANAGGAILTTTPTAPTPTPLSAAPTTAAAGASSRSRVSDD